ncbi:MAG: PA2169 family four-helix-bundle protein [Flavobacteriales bacterium]
MELTDDMTQLNNIHDLLEDSRLGYMEAAERVEDEAVRDLLGMLSTGRVKLQEEVEALRRKADPEAPPREGGTLKGDLHRTWMDLRDALSKSDNANVLKECERGEGFLLMRYDEVLVKNVAPETFTLANRQRNVVEGNLDRIKQLRSSFEKIEQ